MNNGHLKIVSKRVWKGLSKTFHDAQGLEDAKKYKIRRVFRFKMISLRNWFLGKSLMKKSDALVGRV
jgi:hypothetical protein